MNEKKALIKWFNNYDWDIFGTLTFKYSLNEFDAEKILKLYKEYNVKVAPNTKIFLNRSIRDGLNNLLKNTDLKHKKIGEEFVKRDGKSFRHTYIFFQIDNGVPTTDIAKNLDTSTEMIDKFYTANVQTEELIDRLTRINRIKLKIVS